MGARPRLLVTGFGPFPGTRENPSARAARDVARSARLRRLGAEARAVVLATTYAAIEQELLPALHDQRPDAVLMIGIAGRSKHLRVETRGLNRTSILSPDASRALPIRLTLAPGRHARLTRAKPAVQATGLRRHGLRCRASIDAGRYLCNAAYFAALEQPVPVLFVHVPKPGRALAKRSGARARLAWRHRLAAALTDVGIDLLRQAGGPLRPG